MTSTHWKSAGAWAAALAFTLAAAEPSLRDKVRAYRAAHEKEIVGELRDLPALAKPFPSPRRAGRLNLSVTTTLPAAEIRTLCVPSPVAGEGTWERATVRPSPPIHRKTSLPGACGKGGDDSRTQYAAFWVSTLQKNELGPKSSLLLCEGILYAAKMVSTLRKESDKKGQGPRAASDSSFSPAIRTCCVADLSRGGLKYAAKRSCVRRAGCGFPDCA